MKSLQEEIVITAKAPGKLILSGEHAVVYGGPALAMAVNHYAETTITKHPGDDIRFEVLDSSLKQTLTLHELKDLEAQIAKRYRKFTVGKYQIKDVIRSPIELIQYAFVYLVENLFLPITGGLKIQVALTLPVGCGMGASAAVILSLTHALVNYCDHIFSADKYLYFGREIENLQHGKSSGLDLFLSYYGGCYLFVGGDASKRKLPAIPFTLVNTGKPKVSTGECVEAVTTYLQNSSLMDDFGQVALAMDKALEQNNIFEFANCIKENHQLLKHIGVVPKKVVSFIEEIEARGGAAKVSGAGAITDDRAGVVLIASEKDVSDIVEEYGYEVIPAEGESDGVKII